MNKRLETAYFIKKLYMLAAKQLIKHCHDYYLNAINTYRTESVLDMLKKDCTQNKNIILCDKNFCAFYRITEKMIEYLRKSNDVYCFMDDVDGDRPMAVFALTDNIMLYSNTLFACSNKKAIMLDSCYFLTDRRKYSDIHYLNIIFYYYCKSENIDKELSL